LLSITGSLIAQETRGTVLGRVSDSSSAVIPAVEVRAVNQETGTVGVGKSNESGNYVIPYLIPGMYSLQAELGGFKRFVRDSVQVRVNDVVTVDIVMSPGAVSETVEVKDVTPLMDLNSASLGQVIDQRRVLDLPLMGGNPFQLVQLSPGTVNAGGLRIRDATRVNVVSEITTDGNRKYSNEFSIDGVSNMASYGTEARVAFNPPAAAVSEFKVQSVTYDAALGHTAGAVINVATTAGTNSLHGEMHEWLRNRVLDAPTYFNNRSGQKLAVYQNNRFGASGGGPVVIPGLYNGKNRSFWFFAYEGNIFTEPQTATFSVPNPTQLTGDLSGLLKLGSQYQIYDPATTTPDANGRFRRTPLAGNIIPASRIAPVARNVAKFWPAPNQSGTIDGRSNFFNGAQQMRKNYNVQMGRFDHAFSDSHRLFVRAHRDWLENEKDHNFNNAAQGNLLHQHNKGAGLDDVWVVNPTFIVNLRYGFVYFTFPAHRTTLGIDLAALGFDKNFVALTDKSTVVLPQISLGGYTGFSSPAGEDGTMSSMIHSFSSNLTKLAGSHMARFGAEYRVTRANINRNPSAAAPQISFSTNYTRGPLDNSTGAPIGQDLASLLLGIPTGGAMLRSGGGNASQDQFLALYLQDDWKLTHRLTLNLGLRYEYESPLTERFNRSVNGFDFSVANPIEPLVKPIYAASPIPDVPASIFSAKGGLLFAGVNGRPRTFWDSSKTNFMPRIGLSFAFRPTTIVRGGYGVFFDSNGTSRNMPYAYGFDQSTPIVPSLDNGVTYIASFANPFPSGLTPPPGASGGLATYVGQSVSFYRRDMPRPYAQRWSFGLQQQFLREFVLDVTYVGNRGTRLPISRQHNPIPRSAYSTSPVRDQQNINYMSTQVKNPFAGLLPGTSLNGANVGRTQLMRPYPEFYSISAIQPQGYGWYHSLQARAEKRFSKGYTLSVAYTWSKNMEALSYLNESDPLPERVVSGWDYTHRLAVSGIYELPFGRGKKFAAGANRFLDGIVGGWQVTGMAMRQSGAPLGFGNAIFNGNLKDIMLPRGQRTVDRWFNVDAGFDRSTQRQLDWNLRSFPSRFGGLRADGQHVWDMSALKHFRLTERFKLQFRAEVYNALNHPNFTAPNTSPTSSAFGTVTGQEGNPRQWQLALKVTF
jgi:hypothetical protein